MDRAARGLPMSEEDCRDCASALDRPDRGREAISWHEHHLAMQPEADFTTQPARERIKVLQ